MRDFPVAQMSKFDIFLIPIFNLVQMEEEAFVRLSSDAFNEESERAFGSTANTSTDWQAILFSTE